MYMCVYVYIKAKTANQIKLTEVQQWTHSTSLIHIVLVWLQIFIPVKLRPTSPLYSLPLL